MPITRRTIVLSALLLCPASALRAQSGSDVSGHWDGLIQAPNLEISFQVDIARTATGELGGTITIPSQELRGLPLQQVSIKDKVVSFSSRRDQSMAGFISDDGKSISGDYSIEGFTLPFSLIRTGEARIEPPLKSPRISKELEGTWTGSLQAASGALRASLTMVNQPDGSAIGRLVVIDQGGLELPVAITQDASKVTLDCKATPGRFSGTLNAQGTELAGTWTQGAAVAPLTFHRAADGSK